MDWERGLVKTWDMLYPCENPNCREKWFVLHDIEHPVCPFCGKRVNSEIVKIKFKKELRGKSGQWMPSGELIAYNNYPLFSWHIYSNVFADEKADRDLCAYVVKHQGNWLLVNQKIKGMRSPSGNLVPPGQAVLLKNGTVFRLSDESNGQLAEIQIKG